ncbi:MAG: tetratricopeptide repeat protein [Burkholderiales bacterium]|nr:tetratricopeptide repeat protein [Bacteroidia bacterium]
MKNTFKIQVCFFLLLSCNIFSQNGITDSLRKIAARVNKDSSAKLYVKIANIFTGVNSDSVRKYATIADKIAPSNSISKGDVLIQFGNSYHMENKVDSALSYYNKALMYFQKIGNDKGIAKVYQSYAIVKRTLGDYEGAIQDSKKAYEVYDKITWTLGKVNVLNNISNAYSALKKYNEAVYYSRKSFSLSKLLGDSLKYYSMMSDYGGKLIFIKKLDSAVYYINAAAPFFERNNMYAQLLLSSTNLAEAFWNIYKNTALTKEYYYKALKYAYISGAKDNLNVIYRELTMCYILEKKSDSAEVYFMKTLNLMDSTNNLNAINNINEIQTKYETEKKELQIKSQSFEIEVQEKQNKQKSLIILFGTLALVGTGFFATMAFINFRKAKKANLIIENQKLQVELKNEEITHQKELVDEKQKEIIDSINYAKRIQQAVLTGEDVWNKVSKEHFILFKPKDIVSGDFYWAYNTPNNRSVFALADCTGHGVPGGFMSMLGNSFLNEIVIENKIFKANEILNKLRSKIIKALEQKGGTQQKDGMDISLCVWNKIDNTLEFSGANNPLWLLRKTVNLDGVENKELQEYKADKMPIGLYLETEVPFSSITIQLEKGDIIYLSTDGYADQFGGTKEKKLKYKPLIESLIKNSALDMASQKDSLETAFNSWKSNLEQVDDVSIIGIRI